MNVLWTPRALADVAGIFAYIAGETEDAAARVVDGLMAAGYGLGTHPRLGRPGRRSGTRELIVGRSVMVYRIAAEIAILTVVHGARRR